MNHNPPAQKATNGFWSYLSQFWELARLTNRYALVARFCVIAGLAAAVALLTVEQGRELLRAMAEPRAATFANDFSEAAYRPGLSEMDWHHLGWFSFAIIVLSLACWASTRMCYALMLETEQGENFRLEKLIERKLPMYFGALPLVIAGLGFLQETFAYLPADHRPNGLAVVIWGIPLGLLFGVPALVILRWVLWPGNRRHIARSAPGLRYILYICAALPALSAVFLYFQRSQLPGGFPVILSTLFAAQYFFVLANAIFRFEQVWVILLPGIALLFTRPVTDPHDRLSLMTAALAHICLGILMRRIAAGRMQTRLALSRDLHFGQVVRMIFFFPSPQKPRVGKREIVTLRAAGVVGVILVAVLFLSWFNPQGLPRLIGPAAVLCLALTAWVVVGNGLLIATRTVRLPLVLFAVVWALISSICEDNHVIRLARPSPLEPANAPVVRGTAVPKPYGNVEELFVAWHKHVESRYPLRQPEIERLCLTAAAGGDGIQAACWTTQVLTRLIDDRFPALQLGTRRPCFIVATEGGGIRAAFWTAQVLTRLEDESRQQTEASQTPDFGSHLLAISGVSGGSLGASVFDALYADTLAPSKGGGQKMDAMGLQAAGFLGADHLSPLVGAMLFPDALQRFCPWTLPGTDRGAALEGSWENRWRFYVAGSGPNRFQKPFLDLWKGQEDLRQSWLPALFLNATRVEDGRRIIASNVKINSGPTGNFPDALDLHDFLWSETSTIRGPGERLGRLWGGGNRLQAAQQSGRLDLPLSTATHCSARFTYFSPAARLPSGQRVVDGGYYEDSGGETANDILKAVKAVIDGEPSKYPVEPIVLLIRFVDSDKVTRLDFRLLTADGSPATVASYALSDLLSPLLALMNVRDAHATDEYASFGRLEARKTVYQFQLAQRQVPLPLGWMLSGRAAGEMVTEMPGSELPEGAASSPTIEQNHQHLSRVLDLLKEMTVKAPESAQ